MIMSTKEQRRSMLTVNVDGCSSLSFRIFCLLFVIWGGCQILGVKRLKCKKTRLSMSGVNANRLLKTT